MPITHDIEEIVDKDFTDARHPDERWTARRYTRCSFLEADLVGLRTDRVVFIECDFTGADLTESRHQSTAFRNCTFNGTTLWHSTFR